ncbi:acyltransferase-like protein, chloroplastic, partial [Tanacetum coccineum]
LNDYGLTTDEDILTEMIKMEFDKDSLIETLRNRVQNEDVYNRINLNEAAASALAQRPTGYIDYQGTNMRGQVEIKWALGLQACLHSVLAGSVSVFINVEILGKLKDFIGIMAKSNKKLQQDAMPRILAMKTKNRSIKRKLPYDSEVECSITRVSKKQNFDPSDMFAHDSGTNVDNRGSKIPLNMHPLHGDSSSIEISLTQTADSLAHEQQHGTIDIPSQPVIVGPTSTLSGTCASAAAGTIIPDVYSKKSSHMCANNKPLLQMFTDKETKQLRTNNRRMRPKQPQPGFQRLRSSDNKPARICDPKSIRPRYEMVTECHPTCFISKKPIYLIGESFGGCLALAVAARNPTVDLVTILANPSTSFERRRLPTLLYLLEALPDVLYGALNLIFLSAIRGLGDILPKDTLIWRLKLLKSAAAICCLMSEMIVIKLGVVGFSMGVAMALYCATCRALGQYGNGIRFPINLSVVMAINGWLPCSRIIRSRVHASQEAIKRASSLHILLCHGQDHCQWSCKESCLDLLLHVKPCGDRVRPFVIEGLLKDLSRMSNTSDKGTMFGDGAARVGMQLRSSPKAEKDYDEFSKAYFSSLNLILRAGFRGCVSGGWSWLIRKSSESFSRNGRWILDCQRRIDSYSDMGLNCMMSPRCDTCKIFGHVHDYCPKKVVSPPIVATSNVVTPNAEKTNDGFQTVGKKKKRKGKSKSINGASVYWSVGLNIIVRLSFKATYKCTKEGNTYVGFITFNRTSYVEVRTGNSSKKDNLSMSNSFSSLNEEEEEGKDERSW